MTCSDTERNLRQAAAACPEIRIETISEYQEFLNLQPIWDELVEAAGCDYPFLEHAWVRTWWESFGAGSTLHILLLKAGDQPVAIAPMISTTIRMWGIKVRRLGFFYNAHVPRADFIIAHRPEEVYRVIWNHLRRNCSWDLLQLCQLPEGSTTLDEVPRLAATNRCPTGAWASGPSPYQTLSSSWHEYFNSLAAKHRSNLRNRFKRLETQGPVEIETITRAENLADAVEAGLQLEAAAWKGDAGTAIACDPDISRFYSTLAQRAAERGWILLHFLDAGTNRIAFDYSLCYRNRIYRLKSGYDPVYAAYSPSNLLQYLVMQSAFEQHVVEYDFLGISEEWKLRWTKEARAHHWLFIFSPTLKGHLLHLIKFRLVPLVKRALSKFHGFIARLTTRLPIAPLQGPR